MAIRKTCPTCKNPFLGRKNRIYCTLACKSQANNERQEIKKRFQNSVITKLLKNRAILLDVMHHHEAVVITKKSLEEKGYDLLYFTSVSDYREKLTICCFEFGIFPFNQEVRIVRFKKDVPSQRVIQIDGIDDEFLDELFR